MAITESEFDRAFREVVALEFKDIPLNEEEIDCTFSKKFERKMDKLIRTEKKVYWRFVNTAYKKAIIAAVVITLLLTGALSVSAVRKSLVHFITEIYETFVSFAIDGEGTNEILHEYMFSSIPDGFTETNALKNPAAIEHEYTNDIGEKIELTQGVTDGFVLSIDNEHGTLSEITVKGFTVYVYVHESNTFTSAQWTTEDGYVLTLSYEGETDIDTMIALIESIE